MLNDINNPELLQDKKINLDVVAYQKKIDADLYKPSVKNELIVMLATLTGQPQQKKKFSGLCFSPI